MKKTLLITSALFINLGGAILNAQEDVTSQYITNPSFENSEAVEITECKGYGSVVHGNGHCLMIESSVAHGYDYESTGWKLESQNTNANGGVVVYGNKVQYSKSGSRRHFRHQGTVFLRKQQSHLQAAYRSYPSGRFL